MQDKETLPATKFSQEGLGDNSFGKVLLHKRQEAAPEGVLKGACGHSPGGTETGAAS